MKLQTAPIGLLGAYGLKNNGANPPEFGDAVTPTVEVSDHYLATQGLVRASATFNLAIAGLNNSVNVSVTAQKAWRVLAAGISATINVADAALQFDYALFVNQPGLTPPVPFATGQMVGSTLNKNGAVYLGRPLFLPAGWAIVASIYARAAGPSVAVACVGSALVQEFDL